MNDINATWNQSLTVWCVKEGNLPNNKYSGYRIGTDRFMIWNLGLCYDNKYEDKGIILL